MSAVPHFTEERIAELCDLATVTDWLERAWRDLGAGEAATTLRVRAAAGGLMGSAMAASWPRHRVVGGKLYLTHPDGFAFLVGLFSPDVGLVATFDGAGAHRHPHRGGQRPGRTAPGPARCRNRGRLRHRHPEQTTPGGAGPRAAAARSARLGPESRQGRGGGGLGPGPRHPGPSGQRRRRGRHRRRGGGHRYLQLHAGVRRDPAGPGGAGMRGGINQGRPPRGGRGHRAAGRLRGERQRRGGPAPRPAT